MALAGFALVAPMASCSDEPDAENYYTFTGEMLSDYLNNRAEYSDFKTICERAKLMDLLATYGQYTCFLPSNEAVQNYLKERGLSSLSQLSDADCDTIARTHLVANMYSTFEMTQDRLPTANLLGRYLATSQGVDNDSNAVVYLEGTAHIYFEKTALKFTRTTPSRMASCSPLTWLLRSRTAILPTSCATTRRSVISIRHWLPPMSEIRFC